MASISQHAARDSNHALELLQDAEKLLPEEKPLWLGLVCCRWERCLIELLDDAFPQRPVVAINDDKSYCWMNRAAVELYGFTAEECSAEARIALLDEMLSDTAQLKKKCGHLWPDLPNGEITAIKTFVSTMRRS